MDTGLRIESVPVDGATVVRVAGEVDVATAEQLDAALRRHVCRGATVIADLADITFMAIAGARVLRTVHDDLTAIGGRLIVWRPRKATTRVLVLSDMDTGMHIRDDPRLPTTHTPPPSTCA